VTWLDDFLTSKIEMTWQYKKASNWQKSHLWTGKLFVTHRAWSRLSESSNVQQTCCEWSRLSTSLDVIHET